MRQGCPLSPLLYVLVSKVLSTKILECPQIIGFHLPGAGGLHFKISQYADDATIFVKSERSLFHLFRVVHDYAKLNTAKSRLCGLVGGETMAPPPMALINGSRK